MNKQKGFTIIELIVVIAIIAVLAAIVLINVQDYIKRSKDTAIKSDLHTVLTSLITLQSSNSMTATSISADTAWVQITGTNGLQTGTGTSFSSVDTTNNKFCACVQELYLSTKWACIDTTGVLKEVTTACTATNCGAAANPACPAS